MKTNTLIIMILFFFAILFGPGYQEAFGDISSFRYYFGSLHNHSAYSDGKGTPEEAFRDARIKGKLDFFALTDHSSMISSEKWDRLKKLTKIYNRSGHFVALHGFEWSHPYQGHVVVIGTEAYCTESEKGTDNFRGFLSWLKKKKGIAFFAHPGERNFLGREFNLFRDNPIEEVVGIELWNKKKGFSVFYYNDGYYKNDGGKGFFDEALIRGWRIGAAGGEDNHQGTFGTMTDYRVGILASALTKEDIVTALKRRRFYATADKNLKLFFSLNGKGMGDFVSPGFHKLLVQVEDPDGEKFTRVEVVKNGMVIKTWRINNERPFLTYKVNCRRGDYLYIRVLQFDGDEAISSPVFVR